MGFNIWSEVPLSPGSLARLQSLGQVNENGTFANLPGCDVAIIGPSTVDAGFIAQSGPSLQYLRQLGGQRGLGSRVNAAKVSDGGKDLGQKNGFWKMRKEF